MNNFIIMSTMPDMLENKYKLQNALTPVAV